MMPVEKMQLKIQKVSSKECWEPEMVPHVYDPNSDSLQRLLLGSECLNNAFKTAPVTT